MWADARRARLVMVAVWLAGCAAPASRHDLRNRGPASFLCEGELVETAHHTYCVYEHPLGFEDASARCGERGGHLAVVESEAENTELATALRADSALEQGHFWMGLAEHDGEDSWLWASGRLPRFGAWAPGEPNDAGGEDCAVLLGASGNWNDEACSNSRPYVCERLDRRSEAGPARALGCTGQRIITLAGEYCFYGSARRTWNDARDACLRSGGQLAELADEAENAELRAALKATARSDRYWIGLADYRTEGAFQWVTGGVPTFLGFRPGEPNNAGGDEDCTELFPRDGKWNDVPCGIARASVCEVP